jgi:hypothetical protein
MSKFNLDEKFLTKLDTEKKKYVPSRSAKLPEAKVSDILSEIKKNFNLTSQNEAIATLALLFQQGGSARGCDGNMSITIFDQTVKLADIRKILKNNSCNKAERKLARSLASEIYAVCFRMNVPGNLYNKISKLDLNVTYAIKESAWMSDFQSDNPDCPSEIKNLILQTFKEKSNKNKKK